MSHKITPAVLTFLTACGGPATVDLGDTERERKLLHAEEPIAEQYIVATVGDVTPETLLAEYGGTLGRVFGRALPGFVARMTSEQAEALAADRRVLYVAEDGIVRVDAVQTGAPWHLDRLDQRALPLDSAFSYDATGAGVTIYVIDTGLRLTHAQLAGRAGGGYDFVGDGNGVNDCNGHGTHVATLAAGTTYGVAKNAIIQPLRVLGCDGSGELSAIIAALDLASAQPKPAVASLSLGGGYYQPLNDAVRGATNAGLTVVVAAGNETTDACLKSPASAPEAITVGATDGSDRRAEWSNYGLCVDVFAPGVDVLGGWPTSDTGTAVLSGTSMATPQVAGLAALVLSLRPSMRPAEVAFFIGRWGTGGRVNDAGPFSPNVLAYAGALATADLTPPTATFLNGPGTVRGNVTLAVTATDASGILGVDFVLDGRYIASTGGDVLSAAWDSTQAFEGANTIEAWVYDTMGNRTVLAVVLNVDNYDARSDAARDATLGAPLCSELSSACDSGSLLRGRGTMGPEAGAPNTVHESCADGNAGVYGYDESIERIRVRALSERGIATGEAVEIDVELNAYFQNYDVVHLFHADNPDRPLWTYVGSFAADHPGKNVFTTSFILGSGYRQVFRAVSVFGAFEPSPCIAGDYHDHDDLVITAGTPRAPAVGELVVSEIMINPAGVEPNSEWLEIVNISDAAISLAGISVWSGTAGGALASAPVLAPRRRAVLCYDPASGPAGCIRYSGAQLKNSGADDVRLERGGVAIDRVAYDTAAGWSAVNGVSIELSESRLDVLSNDAVASWCRSVTAYGAEMATPGQPGSCP